MASNHEDEMYGHEHGDLVAEAETGPPPDEEGFETGAPEPSGQSSLLPPWLCRRRGPVSGRYGGTSGRTYLDLRVDIDPRSATSPTLNRISGDLYDVYHLNRPGVPPVRQRVYRASWIVDAPRVRWSRCFVTVTGIVRFWQGTHPATKLHLRIPWATFFHSPGPAEARFTSGTQLTTFICPRLSNDFRDVTLEIDVCSSVANPLVAPSYHTHAHPNRPAGTVPRALTVQSVYREAGIGLTINTGAQTAIDDSDASFQQWSPAELHDAMETAFSEYGAIWPRWHLWGLLAGSFDNSGVAGIMFDAAAAYGGAGDAPERQGFALFSDHSWFANLPAGQPANESEAAALRDYVYTWIHEAGHAFNFLHSWNKSRPDALSWMNYPWRYDGRNGDGSFWGSFPFCFDEAELVHIRHGDRASVIMGGDPWASGGHLEAPADASIDLDGPAPLELVVRSKGMFELMEDVRVELRIRNGLEHTPIEIDERLAPEYGVVTVYVRRPDGRIREFQPLYCLVGPPQLRVLDAKSGAAVGTDRYSNEISISFGASGFAFDAPGEYAIRVVYHGSGGIVVPSRVHRIRVLTPSKALEQHATDFFRHDVGLFLALGGSGAERMKGARDVFENIATGFGATHLGVRAAEILAAVDGRDFFEFHGQDRKLRRTKTADLSQALERTEKAKTFYEGEKGPSVNLRHSSLARTRADWLAQRGDQGEGSKELQAAADRLEERKVYSRVTDELRADAQALASGAPVVARRKRRSSGRDLKGGTDRPRRGGQPVTPPS